MPELNDQIDVHSIFQATEARDSDKKDRMDTILRVEGGPVFLIRISSEGDDGRSILLQAATIKALVQYLKEELRGL